MLVAGSFVAVVTAVVARLVTRSFVAVLAAVVGKPFRLTRAPRVVKESDKRHRQRHRQATPSNGLAAPSDGLAVAHPFWAGGTGPQNSDPKQANETIRSEKRPDNSNDSITIRPKRQQKQQ